MGSPPPTWLPPLNSHEDYTIHVEASEPLLKSLVSHHDHPNMFAARNVFVIRLRVTVDFYPNYKNDAVPDYRLCGLSYDKILMITRNPKSLARLSLRQHLLTRDLIPFPLNHDCYWREKRRCPGWVPVDGGEEELSRRIFTFLRELSLKPENAKLLRIPVDLCVLKTVRIPGDEFGSWKSWYMEKKRVNRKFIGEFKEAITRPRTVMELRKEETMARLYIAASSASVRQLESVVYCHNGGDYDGDGSAKTKTTTTSTCVICLEEIVNGMRVTRLPCLHVFHGDCAMRWLRGNHVCPVCRHQLPTQ